MLWLWPSPLACFLFVLFLFYPKLAKSQQLCLKLKGKWQKRKGDETGVVCVLFVAGLYIPVLMFCSLRVEAGYASPDIFYCHVPFICFTLFWASHRSLATHSPHLDPHSISSYPLPCRFILSHLLSRPTLPHPPPTPPYPTVSYSWCALFFFLFVFGAIQILDKYEDLKLGDLRGIDAKKVYLVLFMLYMQTRNVFFRHNAAFCPRRRGPHLTV